MNLDSILICIKMYENTLNTILVQNDLPKIKLKLKIGYNRCMARIKGTRIRGVDINNRCCRHIFSNNLCKIHLSNATLGLVNRIPSEEVMTKYKNHKYSINLNHTPFFSLNLKKKNTDIIKMSHTQFDYSICENANGSTPEEIYDKYIRNNGTMGSITIGEKKMILSEIKKQVEQTKKTKRIIKKKTENYNSWRNSFNKYLREINIQYLNSIKIIDENFNDCVLYEVIFKNETILINNKKRLIGKFNNWIDDEDEIPAEYKTADNKVLHPNTCLPILEIIISKIESIYCDILPGTYREFVFDEELESFKKTNSIVRSEG